MGYRRGGAGAGCDYSAVSWLAATSSPWAAASVASVLFAVPRRRLGLSLCAGPVPFAVSVSVAVCAAAVIIFHAMHLKARWGP